MSRVANNPITLPKGTEIKLSDINIDVKGPKGNLSFDIHPSVKITHADEQLSFSLQDGKLAKDIKFAGTTRAIINNIVKGVTEGWTRKLLLEGTGYRAQMQGKDLKLMVGHSHDDIYVIPKGITIECPSNKEIVVSGIDKQLVGQVAADIRAYRPPEPYKGKGVRYSDERIQRKEVKKK